MVFIVEFGSELSEGNGDEMKTFNEDIVCCHGTVPSWASRMMLQNISDIESITVFMTKHKVVSVCVCVCSCCRSSEYFGD